MRTGQLVVGLAMLLVAVPLAGNAHFVGAPQLDASGRVATASGKVAGLGNVPQIHVVVSADAACVNNGGHHPKAENKATFSTSGDFPVQNGRAEFDLALVASFSPSCDPPMTVVWSDLSVVVTAADGTFLVYP